MAEVVGTLAARPRRAACPPRHHMTMSTDSVIRVGDEYQVQLQQPCRWEFVEPLDKPDDLCLREKQMGTILSLEDSVGELMATSTAAPAKKFRVDCLTYLYSFCISYVQKILLYKDIDCKVAVCLAVYASGRAGAGAAGPANRGSGT